jgi:hypothetical protein
MNGKISLVLIVSGAIGMSSPGACTSRDIYEATQQDRRTACLNEISGIERDKCLRRNSQSYDEFNHERKQVQRDTE